MPELPDIVSYIEALEERIRGETLRSIRFFLRWPRTLEELQERWGGGG